MPVMKSFEMLQSSGRIDVMVTSASTNNAFTINAYHMPPGGGAPPHVHTSEDEIFSVVEGEFEVFDGAKWRRIAADESVPALRGYVHAFRNSGSAPGTLVSIATPGNHDRYLEEISSLVVPKDSARLQEIARRYGITYIDANAARPPRPRNAGLGEADFEGRTLRKNFQVLGEPVEILTSRKETAGAFTILLQSSPAGGGPPLHRHAYEDEIFTVVKGDYEIAENGIWRRLHKGEFAPLLRGHMHTFRNCGETQGTVKAFVVSGTGLEQYLEDISEFELPEDKDRLDRLSADYGIEVHGPTEGWA